MLKRLVADGIDLGAMELPFSSQDMACWLRKDCVKSMTAEDLITAMKVRGSARPAATDCGWRSNVVSTQLRADALHLRSRPANRPRP